MKIVHLDTERTWRGGERQVFWLARELERRGHKNVVACRPRSPLSEAARDAGLETFALSPLGEADVFAACRLRRFLRRGRADVLHAHTGHAVGLAALAAGRTALVATRRVDVPVKRNFFSRWKYRRCARVAAISGFIRQLLLSSGLPPERVPLVPSGIDAADYPSAADRGRLRRGKELADGAKLVVNVAALAPHKDQATLLEAAPEVLRRVPEAAFLIVGDGELREELAAKSRALGVDHRVSFLGHRRDAVELTALADVFVLCSREEGLGTALLDALTVGVPTVATRAGGIPDIYGSAEAPELVPPGDPRALAEAIVRVLTDPREAEDRVARGRERARGFSASAMADAYERIYRDVILNG